MNKAAKTQYKALPKFILIGQREYKVIISNEDKDATLHASHAYTMVNHDTIVVNDNLSAAHLRSTLLHEILHAIRMVTGNTFSEVPEKDKEEDYDEYYGRWEHHFIYLFSEPLVQVIRNNPDLLSFLTLSPQKPL
jgi:Zn-dependent peptidase ImmA (M78 family)